MVVDGTRAGAKGMEPRDFQQKDQVLSDLL